MAAESSAANDDTADLMEELGRQDIEIEDAIERAAASPQLDPLGEVWDHRGARFRCRIERKLNWRGKAVYRWVLERYWTSWRDHANGRWTSSETKANERGRAVLLAQRHDRYEEVGRV